MTLKGWTLQFSFLPLIFGMAQEADSVVYHCHKDRLAKEH
jgi:hypothetical protein